MTCRIPPSQSVLPDLTVMCLHGLGSTRTADDGPRLHADSWVHSPCMVHSSYIPYGPIPGPLTMHGPIPGPLTMHGPIPSPVTVHGLIPGPLTMQGPLTIHSIWSTHMELPQCMSDRGLLLGMAQVRGQMAMHMPPLGQRAQPSNCDRT